MAPSTFFFKITWSIFNLDWLQVVNKLHYLKSIPMEYCNLPNNFHVPVVNSSTSLDILDLSYIGLTCSSSVLEWLFNSNTSVVNLDLSHISISMILSWKLECQKPSVICVI